MMAQFPMGSSKCTQAWVKLERKAKEVNKKANRESAAVRDIQNKMEIS